MHQVLFGAALLGSFLGGVLALLAPCCVSVVLPAYFGTGFGRRSGIAAESAGCAAGGATRVSVAAVAGRGAPLAVIALVWEGRDWGSSRVLQGRRVRVGVGRLNRAMPLGTLASGVVLAGMGVLTLVTAVTGPSMPSSGWQMSFAAWLQHASSVTGRALAWLP